MPIDGSAEPVKLTPPLADGGTGVSEFSLSKNSNRVVYLADQDIKGVNELYSVPIDGSEAPNKLNTPLESSSENSGDILNFSISPDGSRVVYLIMQGPPDAPFEQRHDLYSAPIEGGAQPVKFSASSPFGSFVESDFLISPDNKWVIYSTAERFTSTENVLYSAPIDGSTASIKLAEGVHLREGKFRPALILKISPDSRRVVYGGTDPDAIFTLFSIPIEGGTAVKFDAPFNSFVPKFFAITPDSNRIIYSNSKSTETNELLSVSIEDGTPVILHTAHSFGSVKFTPDGRRVVYTVQKEEEPPSEELPLEFFFSAPIDGSTIPVKLSGPPVAGVNVQGFKVSPDGNRVVYIADQDTPEVLELYASYLFFDIDILCLRDLIGNLPDQDIGDKLRNRLVSKLEAIENQACTGNIKSAINKLQGFKRTIEAQAQKINKAAADTLIAGADYSLTLWKSINNQDLNLPAYFFIVENNKLIDFINDSPGEELDDRLRNRLKSRLELVEEKVSNSNVRSAINKLVAFNRVVEKHRNKKINGATADSLIASAENLISQLRAMLDNVQACSV